MGARRQAKLSIRPPAACCCCSYDMQPAMLHEGTRYRASSSYSDFKPITIRPPHAGNLTQIVDTKSKRTCCAWRCADSGSLAPAPPDDHPAGKASAGSSPTDSISPTDKLNLQIRPRFLKCYPRPTSISRGRYPTLRVQPLLQR